MTIATADDLINALGNNNSRLVIDKSAPAISVSSAFHSLWTSTGNPGAGAVPTTAAVCTKATLGAIDFTNQTSPTEAYLAHLWVTSGQSGAAEIHDRIAHRGGLVLNVTASQSVTMDLNTLAPSADRVGAADYSDVSWWIEVYTTGGATASNATINVTYNDGTTGNLAVVAVGGTLRAQRLVPIVSAVAGKYIRGINTVQLSASTGTAGNFGFTATRHRTTCLLPASTLVSVYDWSKLGLPKIYNDSCLFAVILAVTSTGQNLRGQGKIIYG